MDFFKIIFKFSTDNAPSYCLYSGQEAPTASYPQLGFTSDYVICQKYTKPPVE